MRRSNPRKMGTVRPVLAIFRNVATNQLEVVMKEDVQATALAEGCRSSGATWLGRGSPGSRCCAAVASLVAAVAALIFPLAAQSQPGPWPTKPMKIIVAWPAGGNADVWARIVANGLTKALSQPVIVENRPGATGAIGAAAVTRAEPDGYTLLFATPSETTVAAALKRSLPYDPLSELQPIIQVLLGPYLLVANPDFPPNTLGELLQYVKANPRKVNYASFGENTINHLYGEMFRDAAGLDVVHVPYKGGPPALTDLVAGRVQYTFDNVGLVMPLVNEGKLKAIAVLGPRRVSLAERVPTLVESGMSQFAGANGGWLGLFAPAKTPRHIVDRLNSAVSEILKSEEARKAFLERGQQAVGSTPEEFRTVIDSEVRQWKQLAAKVGLKTD